MKRKLLAVLAAALLGGGLAAPKSLNVTYDHVDPQGNVVLTYADSPFTVQLYKVKLMGGAAGVLALLLPHKVVVRAEIKQPGKVPQVVLWRGDKNLNEELMMQGVAQGTP